MNSKTTIPITEARKRIFQIAKDVQKPNRRYTLTENGRPKAVILSAEEFESWQETLEVMRDFPDLKKDIKEAERDYKSGKYKNYITLEDLMIKMGYNNDLKMNKKYNALPTKIKIERRERVR